MVLWMVAYPNSTIKLSFIQMFTLQAVQTSSNTSCKLTYLLSRLFGIIITYTLLDGTVKMLASKIYLNYRDSEFGIVIVKFLQLLSTNYN